VDPQQRIAELEAALAAERARVSELEAQVATLSAAMQTMRELLKQTSRNSNRPPSSDPPGTPKTPRRKKGKGRKRGGQKGHRGTHRVLLPPEQMDAFVDLFPPQCQSCWQGLPQVPDPRPRRYQHTELRPLAAHRTEYRRHAVVCPHCGYRTRAAYDETVIPRSAFGPRLRSVVVLLTGAYHLSRRQTVRLLWELLGVRMSLGSVSRIEARMSETLTPVVEELWVQARAAEVKHADGTSWRRAGAMLSLWVVATTMVTVFKVLPNGQKATLREELFVRPRGILISDRATALGFWAMTQRQICWAHLLRKFISFSERDGPAGAFGKELLEYAGLLFVYWSDYRDGEMSRERFRAWMAPVRAQIEAVLERAAAAGVRRLSGACRDILEHRAALWTFLARDDVEPTNNHAERELRAFVLWRRRSFGTQSERGNRFSERLMSVAHTARKQGRDLLAFLVRCAEAALGDRSLPSLLATVPAA
jgi:transposase